MSNDLVDLMREFGVETMMLGTEEMPDPNSMAMCAMLTEIHELRARIAAERSAVPVIPEGWTWIELQWDHHEDAPNYDGTASYRAWLSPNQFGAHPRFGYGPTWLDALNAAIAAAGEAGQ